MNNVKSLFIIIFLVIFCLSSTSSTDYECTQGDCKNGFGTAVYTDGDKYVGEWKDGKRYGQGTKTLANGNKYVGEFKDSKATGRGTFTWGSGNEYVGE